MSWDSFIKGLHKLSKYTSVNPHRDEVYNILVKHNETAEKEFIDKMNKRKSEKRA